MPERPTQRERERWRTRKRDRPSRIEVPADGQESVWDYPRPPRVEPLTRRLRVEFNGVVLAQATHAHRVIETSGPPVYYFPPHTVRTEYLEPSSRSAFCEWKGTACYWSVRVARRFAEDAVWSYPAPDPGYEAIADHFAFLAGKMDACFLDDERVRPQPGSYYGGWISADVVGPFKGDPGSEGW